MCVVPEGQPRTVIEERSKKTQHANFPGREKGGRSTATVSALINRLTPSFIVLQALTDEDGTLNLLEEVLIDCRFFYYH